METLIEEAIAKPLIDWGLIMIENEKNLQSFIRKRVTNFADVDDLVQTTWLEVLIHKDKFKGESKPETWIFGIAMNLIKIYYKNSQIRSLTAAPEDTLDREFQEKDEPENILSARECLMKAVKKFSVMPKKYQQMLKVLIENDIGYQELANKLSIPIGTVRSRLSRLRIFLRKYVHWEP